MCDDCCNHQALFLGFSGEAFHCLGLAIVLSLVAWQDCKSMGFFLTYLLAELLLLLLEGQVLVLVAMSLDCCLLVSDLHFPTEPNPRCAKATNACE